GEHGRQLERRLLVLGGERGDVHETDDRVVVRGGLGDHDPAVGVPDEQDGPSDRPDDVADVGGVAGDAAQRVGHGDDVEVLLLQLLDDAVPAGGLGEGAVDEDDGEGL